MAHVTVDAARLRHWCDELIRSIDRERVRLFEELIDREVAAAARPRWWRRGRRLSRADARADLERRDQWGYSPSHQATHHAGGQRDLAARLSAAALAADRVVLDAEEFERLHYWSPELAAACLRPGEALR